MSKPKMPEAVCAVLAEVEANRLAHAWKVPNPGNLPFRQALRVAYEVGWTATQIASCLSLSRQAVYDHLRKCAEVPDDSPLWDLISDPEAPPSKLIAEPIEPDELDHLRKLARTAARLRKYSPDEVKGAAKDYDILLVKYLDEGYTVKELASLVGVQPASIYNRLSRSGGR